MTQGITQGSQRVPCDVGHSEIVVMLTRLFGKALNLFCCLYNICDEIKNIHRDVYRLLMNVTALKGTRGGVQFTQSFGSKHVSGVYR